MKHARIAALVSTTLFGAFASAIAAGPGDSREAVLAEFGAPTGTLATGAVEVLLYPQAEVRLRDGRVTAIRKTSAEEQAAEAAAAVERTTRLAQLAADGRAIMAARKDDTAFAQLSAGAQLAWWSTFAARYPMIPIDAETAVLRERVALEQRARELAYNNELRLAELEARVAEAEARATRAETEAWRARYDYRGFGFGYISRGPRIPHRDHPPRPVTPREPLPLSHRGQVMGDYDNERAEIYSRATQ